MRAFLVAALLVSTTSAQTVLKIRAQPSVNRTTIELPLEEYVAAVLAGEASTLRSDEALKAMAVAARTFGIYGRGRHAQEGYDLCGTTHCQRLDLAGVTPRLAAAALATAGELLWSAGKPAFAVYSRDCGGMTEDVSAVWPEISATYLRRQTDPYCTRGGSMAWEWRPKPADLLAALANSQLRAPRTIEQVAISGRTESGRARELTLAGSGERVRVSATTFRFAVGRALGWDRLPGDRYEVAGLDFRGSGSGHGVGLCQRGAEGMGAEGRSYREILAFYYRGTEIGRTGRGIAWTRLGGENIALFTTHPDRDGTVLAQAEGFLRESVERTGLMAPHGIEIRLYPDVDTFRNATGEPGWVAAHTVGLHIDLQIARSLRHELLHVLVEYHAAKGLHIWFREGLVGYLEDPRAAHAPSKAPADADLQQTSDPDRARRAYAAATAAVGDLVRRYGERTILGWVTAGLPRELTPP
ncbi:MAG: SpoIID/LytB domain-containing protein [Ignavibacteriota bacterium]